MVINVKRPPNIYYGQLYINLQFNSNIIDFYNYIPIKYILLSEFTFYKQIHNNRDITFLPSLVNKTRNYVNYNKKIVNEIAKISKLFYKKNFPFIPALIKGCSKDLLCVPFWNKYTKLLSDKIYLPETKNIIKNVITNKTLDNSWFLANEYINDENIYKLHFKKLDYEECTLNKSRQIHLYFTKLQKKYMRQFIGTYRYFYNRCVSYFNNYDKKTRISKYYVNTNNKLSMIIVKVPETLNPYNFISMRKILKKYKPSWLLPKFPEHLIDQAFSEAFVRFNICLTTYKKTHKPFTFQYKRSKEIVHSINLEKDMIRASNSLFSGWKINGKNVFKNLKTSEKFCNYDFKGSSLTYHKILNKFTLNLNYEYKTQKYNTSYRIGAGDPGQRTFLTIYSTDKIVEIGDNACNKLLKVCKEIDIIQSRLNSKEYYVTVNNEKIVYKLNRNRKRNLKKALHNKIKHIKNMRKELHNKCIKYICNNYSTIILPPYEIQNMTGKLNSQIARGMYNLAYYTFREKLINKGKEYNINVLKRQEYYTTKTCGRCGYLNNAIGSNKIYNCPSCKLVIGRDHNASRNILLRNIKDA